MSLARGAELPASAIRRRRDLRADIACVAGAIALGVLVEAGLGLPAAVLVLAGLVMLVGLQSWRLSILMLLAYLPVSGVLWIALYPHTAPAVEAKDFLFVVPAYAGFFGWYLRTKRNFTFPGFPVAPVALFAGLVIVEILNPSLSSPLAGLVGAKVWLFYIPMAFLGYHLIRSRRDLDRLLTLMCLSAILPAVVGIAEAILVYKGHSGFVYSLYGSAASAATQEFASVTVGGAQLLRVPSTFSFIAQYYIFMTAMVAIGYAWWRNAAPRSSSRRWRFIVWLLFLAAVLTSGARGALAFVPLLLIAILILDGRLGSSFLGVLAALAAGAVLMIGLVGASPVGTVSSLLENARVQLHIVFITGVDQASHHLLFGLGTGADTNATRYVSDQHFSATGGWQESYIAKSVLELGIGGLILVALVYGSIISRGLRLSRRLRDPGLKSVSAAIMGLFIWAVAYTVKAQYLDFDPLNIYFWLFTGILFKLAVLDREEARSNGSAVLPPDGLNRELVPEPPDQGIPRAPAAPPQGVQAAS
jgi:hypothetical protein